MSEQVFRAADSDADSDSDSSEADDGFRAAFNATDTHPGYDDAFAGYGDAAGDVPDDRDDAPAEPAVDETPDSAVYQSLGVDRAERDSLNEWGREVNLDDLMSAPQTSADLARNVRAGLLLKAGSEAQQELSERDKDDAVTAALERLEEADDEREMYAAANDLLGEAPDRVANFVQEWAAVDPDAAGAWANAVVAREREAEAQMQALQWTQNAIAAEATRRQAEANDARATEAAISEVVRENPVAARVSPETLAALAQQMPPADPSDTGARAWQANLLRSAAELERAEATQRFRQGILEGGAGEFEHTPDGFRHVGVASASVDTHRLLPRMAAQEQDAAIRSGLRHDPTAEYSEIMDNLRRTDLGLKDAREKADALRKARGRGGG